MQVFPFPSSVGQKLLTALPKKSRPASIRMSQASSSPLPPLQPDILAMRIAEAIRGAQEKKFMASLPPWTQRVIRKLVNQFIPEEFSLILNVDSSVFSEGVAIAFGAQGQTATLLNPDGRRFARLLGQQLNAAPEAQRVAELVVEGGLGQLDEVQKHVLSRIFDPDPQVRSSFVKGLNVGNELPGLLATKIDGRSPAAEIYIVLWLYWPQINAMNSISEVSRAIAPFFKDRPSLAGSWDERFRKLANRLKLSFRAKQVRRRARRR